MKDDGTTWVSDPYLHINDKKVIECREWLNCRVIDCSQQLLIKHASGLSGLQTPQLGKGYRFKTVSGRFIQILNVMHGSHWITVSNVHCVPEAVNVYDSAYTFIDMDAKMQICSFLKPACDTTLSLRMAKLIFSTSRTALTVDYLLLLQQLSLQWGGIHCCVTGTQPR